jgi:hypothetical protein
VAGTVTATDEKTVTLNIGGASGIFTGMIFTVSAVAADGKETTVGVIKAATVRPDTTVCEIVRTEAGQTFTKDQKAFRQVRPLIVGVAGGFGPIAQPPTALSVYLANDLSDRLVGKAPFTRVLSRNAMETWVGPRSRPAGTTSSAPAAPGTITVPGNLTTADSGQRAVLGLQDLGLPETLKKLAKESGVDALLTIQLERPVNDPAILVTARLYDGTDGATIAVTQEKLAVNEVTLFLTPGTTLYEDSLLAQESSRPVLTGSWKNADFGGKSLLIPESPNTNITLVNRDFGSDYTVKLIHNGEHKPEWQETLVLQWKDARNWTGVRFAGDAAFIMGMVEGRQWAAEGRLDTTDKGGRGYLELDAIVIGGNITIMAGGKAQAHLANPLPGFIGLACVGTTDTQATIPSVWRISKLKVVRAVR